MTALSTAHRLLPPYRQLTRLVPYLAVTAALCGTALPLLVGLDTFAIVSLYATVPILVASATYFVTNGSLAIDQPMAHPLSWLGMKLFVAIYFVVHATAVLLAATAEVRPFAYYGLIAFAAGLILFQILRSSLERSHVAVILLQTSLLLLGLIWSVTLKYDYFFGRTDVFPHHAFITELLSTNAITAAFEAYQPFPLWHLLVGFQAMLFDVDPLTLSYLTTGLLYGLVPIVIYALTRRFLFPKRTALVAALGVCFNPFVILYGMYSIPRSVTSFLTVFCLLVLLVEGRRAAALYLGLLGGIAVYHTVSLPFVFVVVGCWFVAERVVAATVDQSAAFPTVVEPWQLLAIPAIQAGYWLISGSEIVSRLVDLVSGETTFSAGSDGATLASQFVGAPYQELINYLVFGLIIFFVLVAVTQGHTALDLSQRGKALLLAALALATVSVPGPALLVGAVSDITPDMMFRFGQYTFPFISIAVGVGIVSVVRTNCPIGGQRARTAVVLLLVFSAAFLAVSNDFVASDNPLAEREDAYSFHLSEAETTSLTTLGERSEGAVTGDYVTCRYLDYPGNSGCGIIQADLTDDRLHFPAESVFVLRTGELERRPLSVYPTSEPVDEPPYSNNRDSVPSTAGLWNELPDRNKVYDSSEVSGYAAR
ncbi:hypothetical protein [Halohasta salina]|uniref:hypothetical protein n=1 Tax=Halohasta salina TaxID=2961621 RepID=UPI0020A2C052|nr:hypothetical protein [Halohasta salina]